MNEPFQTTEQSPKAKRGIAPILLIAIILIAGIGGGVYALKFRNPEQAILNKPFIVPDTYSPEIKKDMEDRVAAAIAQIKENPDLQGPWLEIAVYRKQIGDFESAETIWLYAVERWPDQTTAYANLADLYTYHLKEYSKAETYLKKVIELKPDQISAYRNLHDLYKNFYQQESSLAVDTLLEGLEKNPKNTDLLISLAVYYKEKGDTENAQMYFTEALNAATEQKNTSLVTLLEEEIRALSN